MSKRFCPECGKELEIIRHGGESGCGAIIIYNCPGCSAKWQEDQTGIVARETNLTKCELPVPPTA